MLSTHTGRNDKWLFLGEFSEYLLKTENEQTQGTLTTPSKRIPASLQQDKSSTKFQRVESTSAMQSSGFLSDEFQIAQTRVSHQKFSLSLSFHKRKWMIFGASQLPVPLIRVNISGDLVTNNSERRKVLPQGKMSLLFYVACIGICCFHGIELCPTSHCDLKEYFCKGCSGSKIWSPPLTLLGGGAEGNTSCSMDQYKYCIFFLLWQYRENFWKHIGVVVWQIWEILSCSFLS